VGGKAGDLSASASARVERLHEPIARCGFEPPRRLQSQRKRQM